MSDGGKGSKPRPFSVSNQTYAERWDAIFGKKECKHDVWTFLSTHDDAYYQCMDCGITNKEGPYAGSK